MKLKRLKTISTVALSMLGTIGAGAQQVITGDAEVDFPEGSPNTAVAFDPGGLDVSINPSAPTGTISGWDATDVRFRYDPNQDLMFVAVNTVGPGGDADGNGNVATTEPWMTALGGIDSPDYAGGEAFLVVFDIDQDGTGDVIIGTPNGFNINQYVVASYNPSVPLTASLFGFQALIPNVSGSVLNNPQTVVPGASVNPNDLIVTITNWSTLPFSGTVDDSVRAFSYVMFQGSTADLGVGEEWSPGIGEFGPVEIPEESPEVGSIGNLVWKDTNENGLFEEATESGIPGVVVVLFDSDGNQIGQQITDSEGGYLFTDLPEGDYTVVVAPSNFDDCGTPLYKSGKWALGDGLAFNGSNVTYQPGVAPVSGSFSIAALVQPTLGTLMTVVEKKADPAYAVWISPTGEIQFGINDGSSLPFVSSTGTLTGGLEHIAVTFDGTNASFYINGALDSTVPFTATVSDMVADLFVGRDFVGTINDLRIYDSELSAAVVSGLAFMECGALADFYQTTVIGGVDDNTNKPTTFTYSLAEGENYPGADFGFNELGSIGNTVWCEDDGDGYFEPQDGEMGIAGVEVLLRNSSGDVIATTTTDANGQYLFDNLPAGSYSVEVPLTTGSNAECEQTLASIDQAALNRGYEILDGIAQGDLFYSDRTYTVHTISDTLACAQNVRTANDDRNSTAEDLLTLTLTDDSEVFVSFYKYGHKPAWLANDGWTLTDEEFKITNGSCVWTYETYSKSFPAGDVVLDGPGQCAPMYGVFVKDSVCGVLANKEVTTLRDGDAGDGANRTSPHPVDLGPGQDYILADFGFKLVTQSTCIGNLVFCDNDGDGIFEPNDGDSGIEGVRILLKDSSGNVIAIRYTDSSGNYLFEDLEPGCYTVKVSSRNFKCGKPLYHKTQVVDRSDLDDDNVNRCSPLEVCLEAGDCYVKADFGFAHWCNYHYCNNYWRYNYGTDCWEHRNNCYTNCWRIAD